MTPLESSGRDGELHVSLVALGGSPSLHDQDAHAADRKKVSAASIHVASHEVDTNSDKDESIATSDSEERRTGRRPWGDEGLRSMYVL